MLLLNTDELCLMKRHKTIKMNTEFKKAPSQAEINEVTGDAENSSEKLFNIKRNFYRLSIGVREQTSFAPRNI